MPESRKRPGHPFHQSSDVPARERVRAKVLWGVLFGVFGLLIAWFAVGLNYVVLIIATVVAAVIGYFIGKRMEQRK